MAIKKKVAIRLVMQQNFWVRVDPPLPVKLNQLNHVLWCDCGLQRSVWGYVFVLQFNTGGKTRRTEHARVFFISLKVKIYNLQKNFFHCSERWRKLHHIRPNKAMNTTRHFSRVGNEISLIKFKQSINQGRKFRHKMFPEGKKARQNFVHTSVIYLNLRRGLQKVRLHLKVWRLGVLCIFWWF